MKKKYLQHLSLLVSINTKKELKICNEIEKVKEILVVLEIKKELLKHEI